MSDAFAVFAAMVALASPIVAGPVGPFESAPAIALHGSEEAGASASTEVFYAGGEPIGRLGIDRPTIAREDLPDAFVQALIAVEDSQFEEHMGVDPVGLGRAAIGTLQRVPNAGGGSTLTQQLAKNAVTGARRSLDRKLEEVVSAVVTESLLTKDEILESYANAVFFGRRAEGAALAAQNWFGRDWDQLTLSENAFIAGVLQAPSRLDPMRNRARAKARRDHVLSRMERVGFITQAQLEEAIAEPLVTAPPPPPPETGIPFEDPEFWAWSDARRFVSPRDTIRLAAEGGFRSTIRRDAQHHAQAALSEGLAALNRQVGYDPLGGVELPSGANARSIPLEAWDEARRLAQRLPQGARHAIVVGGALVLDPATEGEPTDVRPPRGAQDGDVYVLWPDGSLRGRPRVQGAVVAIDVATGETIASVGGISSWASEFDRTRARRQPGSAIKPFLWLAGLEAGFGPGTIALDAPATFRSGTGFWAPENYGGRSMGHVPLFTALEQSLNMVAARLAWDVGVENMRAMYVRSGAYPEDARNIGFLSASIGAAETTPFRMALATAALDPRRSDLTSRSHLEDLERMLRGVVTRGTAARTFANGPPGVVGKTGTSQSHRDVWFIGRTGDVAFAVWVGRDDDRPLPGRATGGSTAAPIAAAFVRALQADGISRERIETTPFDRSAADALGDFYIDEDMEAWAGGGGQDQYGSWQTQPQPQPQQRRAPAGFFRPPPLDGVPRAPGEVYWSELPPTSLGSN